MCKKKETYIGKTVGDNIVGFKSRINQHVSDSRKGDLTCKFPIMLFEINVMMKLKSSNQLETYENFFHKKGYDTPKCPAHLKK